ncbi:MAG: hypothetical protein ACYC7A_12980 [Thermoanaerobaculia bacterium]
MRRIVLVVMVVLLAFGLSGCKAKKALEEAGISDSLKETGTRELLEKASEDSYDPPADQRLTEGQVEIYLKVREREKAIADVAKKEMQANAKKAEDKGDKSIGGLMDGFKALGSAADLLTADIRAAQELGYNTAEYQWIKEKVLEASGSAMTQKMQQASTAMMDASYKQLKDAMDKAPDETTKKMYADMLANQEKAKQEMAQESKEEPHVAYNRQLLSKHENALNALATEWSKFSDKPTDEAQNAMKQWEQQLDKSVQDAQNPQQ